MYSYLPSLVTCSCSLKHSIRSQCLTDLDSPFGLNFQTDQIEYYLDLDVSLFNPFKFMIDIK